MNPSLLRLRLSALLFACALAQGAAAQSAAPPAAEKKDFSAAERLLFMNDQVGDLKPPMTLRYGFRRTGSLEPSFEDQVNIHLSAQTNGRCCASSGEFLSNERRVNLPDLPAAEGNPVTLFFLEREIREMNRLTKGSQTHFRKRIRMAVYEAATVKPITVRYKGQATPATEVSFAPYLDDPNRPKYEQLARKRYVFTYAEGVPGKVYALRTLVDQAGQAAPLQTEELLIDGGETSIGKTPP
jgi:hypothetical protein